MLVLRGINQKSTFEDCIKYLKKNNFELVNFDKKKLCTII